MRLTSTWDQQSEPVYVFVILLPTYQLSVVYPSYPKTHMYIHICSSRFFWLPGIFGPGIHGYLSTRYLWVSVDQISMGILFLQDAKAVAKWLIAIPVFILFFQNHFWRFIIFLPEGKVVAKLLLVIPVLLFCPESLFTIHGVLRPSRTTIHSNPIHLICFSNPLHLQCS